MVPILVAVSWVGCSPFRTYTGLDHDCGEEVVTNVDLESLTESQQDRVDAILAYDGTVGGTLEWIDGRMDEISYRVTYDRSQMFERSYTDSRSNWCRPDLTAAAQWEITLDSDRLPIAWVWDHDYPEGAPFDVGFGVEFESFVSEAPATAWADFGIPQTRPLGVRFDRSEDALTRAEVYLWDGEVSEELGTLVLE